MHIDDTTVRRPILGVPWRPPTRVGIILFGVVFAIYFADLLVSAVKLWPGITVEPGHQPYRLFAVVASCIPVCLSAAVWLLRARAQWRLSDGAGSACASGNGTPDATPPAA